MQWASIECNKMQVTKVTVTHRGVIGVLALHPVVVDFDTDLEEFYMILGTAMQISAKQSHVTTPVQVDIIFLLLRTVMTQGFQQYSHLGYHFLY